MNIVSNVDSVINELKQSKKLKSNVRKLIQNRKKAFIKCCTDLNADPNMYDRKKKVYEFLPSCELLSKSHSNIFHRPIKPAMGGHRKYVKTSIKGAKFGNVIKFTIPNEGQSLSECVLHLKISELKSKHYVRYVDYPGHKILEEIKVNIFGKEWVYMPELYNLKYYLGQSASLSETYKKCVGQSSPCVYDVCYEEHFVEQYAKYGYQTYKYAHDELDICIPIYLGIEKGDSIPLIKNSELENKYKDISVEVRFADLKNLLSFQSNDKAIEKSDSHDKFLTTLCNIEICEFYTKHNFIKGENWMLIISKWPNSIITTYETLTSELTSSNDRCSFSMLNCFISNIYVAFRPIDNFTKPSHWFSNNFIKNKTKKILLEYRHNEDEFLYYTANIQHKTDIISNIKISIHHNDKLSETIEHHPSFLSDYKNSIYSKNANIEFGPWYSYTDIENFGDDELISQNDQKSGNKIDLVVNYVGRNISVSNKVMMIVIVEKKNILTVNGESIFNRFNITNEDNIF